MKVSATVEVVMGAGSSDSARWTPVQFLALAVVLVGSTIGSSTAALAQTIPDSRLAVTLTEGYQLTSTSFTQTVTFEQYSEAGSLTTTYPLRRRPIPDLGVTLRIWRHLGLGVAASYLHESNPAQVNAQVPNPFTFSQPRTVSGVTSVEHNELGAHMQASYWMQPTSSLDLIVSGGPTVFRVDQDFVSDITYSQDYPYTTAAYTGASTIRERKTVVGGNIGGEVAWRLARHLGLAGTLRFSRARALFPDASAQSIVIGGLHAGVGIRLRF